MSGSGELGVVDLSNDQLMLRAGPERKLWMLVFLLALRDRAVTIRFAIGGPVVRLSYVVDGNEYELVPPPPRVAGRLMEVVRRGFQQDRPSSRLGRLVGRIAHSVPTSDVGDFPWWSSFRLRLDNASADVAATARAGGNARVLTITLSNVAIEPEAAAERLRGLMEEHFARNVGRGAEGPGSRG